MSAIIVRGGLTLEGSIVAPGAKNSALPVLAATLLASEPVVLHRCPRLSDVENMLALICALGCKIKWEGRDLIVDPRGAECHEPPEHLYKALRSSIFLLGPMVARFGRATAITPGGCDIGVRPIDLHISALSALGVNIVESRGSLVCDGSNMRPAYIHLDYPSVGATENAMMAATAVKGQTVIHNAAREPEIVDLQNFLRVLGYKIHGAGSSSIYVIGGKAGKGGEHSIIADRIVSGTYLCSAAITGGDITVKEISPDHLSSISSKLRECGCDVKAGNDFIRVKGPKRPREIKRIETMPHPGFPTDMQAQFFALCSIADGTSIIVENVFENRLRHAGELARMGAENSVNGRIAVIRGVKKLMGADVKAWDLRGGAAMVLAGLCADGETTVHGIEHVDRGYEHIEDDFSSLGANIHRLDEEEQ